MIHVDRVEIAAEPRIVDDVRLRDRPTQGLPFLTNLHIIEEQIQFRKRHVDYLWASGKVRVAAPAGESGSSGMGPCWAVSTLT